MKRFLKVISVALAVLLMMTQIYGLNVSAADNTDVPSVTETESSSVLSGETLIQDISVSSDTELFEYVVTTPTAISVQIVEAIEAANELYNNAIEGMQIGQYVPEAKTAFQAAINAAEVVNKDTNATETDVDKAVADLNAAKQTFEGAVIKEETGNINDIPSIEIGDLAKAVYYFNCDSSSDSWETVKRADVNNDGKITITDLAFIALRLFD